MTARKRKSYDAEFKRQAVDLANIPDRTDREIEQDLGIYDGAIRTWRRELASHADDAFPGKGRVPASEEELHQLRRENHILRQERDILKKAVVIFSHPPKTGIDS